jgi:hypothetical protein
MPELFGRHYSPDELRRLVGDMSQLAQIRRAEQIEGGTQGAGLIEVFNASGLCFSLLPGRGLDIASAHYKGMSLCYRSKTGDVGPAFYEPSGYGWLRGFFGGLLTTCGWTYVGDPGVDLKEENEPLGQHGRAANLPAREVATKSGWEGDDFVLRARGKMREAEALGTALEVHREISTTLGEKSLRIHDRVENIGSVRAPLMAVYHTNMGFPLLDEGSRFVIASEETTEWLEERVVGPEVYSVAQDPQDDAHDEVFTHRPRADAEGNVQVGMINDRIGLGVYLRFPIAEIPLVNHWQHFHRGNYVVGIEPGNCSVLGREWNRQRGYLEHMDPGDVREFHVEIGVLDGEDAIRTFESSN